MLTKRELLRGLTVSMAAPCIFPGTALSQLEEIGASEIISALSAIFSGIQSGNFQQDTSARLDNIKDQLKIIDEKLDDIANKINKLPDVIKSLLLAQYQAGEIAKYQAIGNTIIADAKNGPRDNRVLENNLNALNVQQQLVANFGAFSAPWITQVFAYQMVGYRFFRNGRQRFEASRKTTSELLAKRLAYIDAQISKQRAAIADYQKFCNDNTYALVGYAPTFGGYENFYILIHDCLGNASAEFQPRGPNTGPNGAGAKISTVWPNAAKTPIEDNPHETRKEVFNGVLAKRSAAYKDAKVALDLLLAARTEAEGLRLLVNHQRYAVPSV